MAGSRSRPSQDLPACLAAGIWFAGRAGQARTADSNSGNRRLASAIDSSAERSHISLSRGFLPIQVEHPDARGLHAVVHHCRDPLQQLITQFRVGLALAAQAGAVNRGRADRRHRPGVSEVAVGRDEPRPPEYLSFVHGVDDQRPLRGGIHLQGDPSMADHVKDVGRFSLIEDVVAFSEVHVGRAPCDEVHRARAEPGEERVAAQQFLHGLHRFLPAVSAAPCSRASTAP